MDPSGRAARGAGPAVDLVHFGLETRRDLPGLDDLQAAGLLDPVDPAATGEGMDAEAALEVETGEEED